MREAEIRRAVEVAIEAVVQTLSDLGLEISKALSEVFAKLIAEVNLLATVRDAVALD